MNFFKNFIAAQERIGKHKTMHILRDIPDNRLRDMGISPELLAEGVRAWPWRSPEEETLPRLASFRNNVAAPVSTINVSENAVAAETSKTAA
jgi:hypothetical protein